MSILRLSIATLLEYRIKTIVDLIYLVTVRLQTKLLKTKLWTIILDYVFVVPVDTFSNASRVVSMFTLPSTGEKN